jgi:Type IV secretion-system coupling protein DNA-binding domain
VFRVSGIDPARPGTHEKQVARPTDTKNAEPEELLDSYLVGTPLADYFRGKFSFSIPQSSRFEHTHIVGGSGHGKTQLLQSLILSDVSLLREGSASLIVIDSQGDMFRKVSSLQAVGEISDRIVLIDPTEIFSPPHLTSLTSALTGLPPTRPWSGKC